MTTSLRPSAHIGGTLRRVGGVALDVVDTGRRTYDFARPLYCDDATAGHLERVRLVAAAGADELLLAVFRQMRTPDADAVAATLDEADALRAHLEGAGVLADPRRFHEAPRVPDLEWRSRTIASRRFEHVTFTSPYTPDPAVPGGARYAEQTGNELAHAWILRQPASAPWVVCVHGAGMGDPLVDLVLFRAAALHRQGFNVAIPVLPHHGPRGAGRFQLAFPSVDLAGNLHGAVQAIADVRAVLAYIATRKERAALHGISLGGYVAASVAALEPSLTAVVAGVPLVAVSEVFRTHAPRHDAEDERLTALVEHARALEVVASPIALGRPAAAVRRIYAGRADRLVPPDQVERLVTHWDVDDPAWYPGGHLGFMTSGTVRRCLDGALVDAGIARRHGGGIVAVP